MNYVIIGNSVSAVNAVEELRQHDTTGKVTIISDEPYPVYSRPLISYLLGNEVTESRMYYRPQNWYQQYNVDTMLGVKVVRIDTEKKQVILADKTVVPYDKLLVATGGKPIIPDVPGKGLKGIFTFTTWDDVTRINQYLKQTKPKKCVVVGGGLIGLKSTEGLMARGIKVTILELADRILSVTFDEKASRLMETVLQQNGCTIITKNTVSKVVGVKGTVKEVVLQDGKRIATPMLVFAIGVTPNIELVRNTKINTRRGIIVDKYMRTSVPDVYAAGDVVETYDVLSNISRPIAIWPNASQQGKTAGYNMTVEVTKKAAKQFTGSFPINSVEICKVPTISMGITIPQDEKTDTVLDFYDEKKPVYKKLVLRENRVIGALFINEIDRAGIYHGLINTKVDVSSFKELLLSPDFGLVSLPREYRKHLVTSSEADIGI